MASRFRKDHETLHVHSICFTGQRHLLGGIRNQMLGGKKSIDLPSSCILGDGKKLMIARHGEFPLGPQHHPPCENRTHAQFRVQRACKPARNADISR